MEHGTFATVIDCIDGRTKQPIIEWVKSHASVDFVDVVTEPGPDKVMTQGSDSQSKKSGAKSAFQYRRITPPVSPLPPMPNAPVIRFRMRSTCSRYSGASG